MIRELFTWIPKWPYIHKADPNRINQEYRLIYWNDLPDDLSNVPNKPHGSKNLYESMGLDIHDLRDSVCVGNVTDILKEAMNFYVRRYVDNPSQQQGFHKTYVDMRIKRLSQMDPNKWYGRDWFWIHTALNVVLDVHRKWYSDHGYLRTMDTELICLNMIINLIKRKGY